MKVLLRLLVLLPLMLLTACVDEEMPDNSVRGNFEALWQIIDQHYCFLDYKAEHIGLDWNEVHQRYANRLAPTMNNSQLFEVLCEMLAELQDGHVNLYTGADVGRNWSWYEDYPRNLDVSLRDEYLGTDYKIASGLRYRILDDNIGYVVYESFASALGSGNISDVLHYLRTCQGLILDVRGNTGGNLSNATLLTGHFTNEKILVGYTTYKRGTGHNDFAQPQAEYIQPSKGIRWQKPVIILTNRECYSATNTFVRNMRACPGVRTLGDQTGGGSGMPFTSELPNGWAVRFSASPQFDAQMQQIEFGIQPDIPCSLDSADVARHRDTLIELARALLKQ